VTDISLVPGTWLDGSSWEAVLPVFESAGHRAHPLTLPGMEGEDADRSKVTLSGHVGAVVTAIDSIPGDVPVTVICTEFSAAMLREWIAAGLPQVREFTRIRDVEYVDLPIGHWPQFTRPSDLGQAILASITSRTA
jgi:pimeloyl-ACP methyl ester carboxylesterase